MRLTKSASIIDRHIGFASLIVLIILQMILNLIYDLESLIYDYSSLIHTEQELTNDRVELMGAFLDIYQTQEQLDICEYSFFEESIDIHQNNYTFYFDEHNQLMRVEKN